jgi:CRISPR/Cas system-associated endonuclease/helicase Cas3
LVLHVLSRQKKKLYIFPKLGEILVNYYNDFFTSGDLIPSISRFVFSLYIADKDYKEKSAKLLNKFLYYMFEGEVNGELLSEAIEMKTTYELKKKDERIYGLSNASKFFSKL